MVGGEVVVVVVVAALGQRVVHNLVEAIESQVVGGNVFKFLRIRFNAVGEAAVEALVEVDVVVAIDTHDFLDHVAFTIDIDLASGDEEFHALAVLVDNLDVE